MPVLCIDRLDASRIFCVLWRISGTLNCPRCQTLPMEGEEEDDSVSERSIKIKAMRKPLSSHLGSLPLQIWSIWGLKVEVCCLATWDGKKRSLSEVGVRVQVHKTWGRVFQKQWNHFRFILMRSSAAADEDTWELQENILTVFLKEDKRL